MIYTFNERKFEDKIEKTDSCWIFNGARSSKGYGSVRTRQPRKMVGAHILAYQKWIGQIDEGMHVLHSCDNPSCVNPEHLSLGTNADNVMDRDSKNRQAKSFKLPQTKLSKNDADNIRNLYFSSKTLGSKKRAGVSYRSLAKRYNISSSTVQQIITEMTHSYEED